MERLELTVDNLLLDLNNPRIGHVESQSDALNAIIELDHRHFRTMMESIREHGLDPGDSLYVIEDDESEDYVVVDGNRRLAALKVLFQPSLLQPLPLGDSLKTRLASIAREFNSSSIPEINCVVFDNRSIADEWILRRHGRGMDGEERIPWGTLEIQRFQKDQSVLDVIEFVEHNASFTTDRWAKVKEEVEKKPSVLKRFLDSRPLRDFLKLSVSEVEGERIPSFGVDTDSAVKALTRIFSDIADGEIDTRTHNKSDDIKDYVEELSTGIDPAESAPTKFRDARPAEEKPATQTKKNPAPVKTSRPKAPRPRLAPPRHPFQQPETSKGQRLLYEASRIKLKDFPLASAFLLRACLEHAIDTYMEANGLPRWDTKKNRALELKHRAQSVIDHIGTAQPARKQDLRGAQRTLTDTNDPASIQALNDYHHNKYHIPTEDTLRTAWDASEALFLSVYGAVNAKGE